jgi:hypothetical protein
MVPDSWLAEWNELTEPVEELLAEVKARRLRAPSRDACASVASALLVMRHKAAVAPLRKDATRGARNGARKSGRALRATSNRHGGSLRLKSTKSTRLHAILGRANASDWRRRRAPSKLPAGARRAADRAFAGSWRPDKIYRGRGSARVGGRQ